MWDESILWRDYCNKINGEYSLHAEICVKTGNLMDIIYKQ